MKKEKDEKKENKFIEGYRQKLSRIKKKLPDPPPIPPRGLIKAPPKVASTEIDKRWTTIYFGPRGSGKSLHQAYMCRQILRHLDWRYYKNPHLKPAIVFSVQKFSKEIEDKYLGKRLYYWSDAKELEHCPRTDCWKGKQKHRLHGCYLIFDDMATILPADQWTHTPVWFRKMFAQARHFGIRILANMQDPFSVDINFRRYVDVAFRFRKIVGSRDPDETKPPVRFVWGLYQRRKIKAEDLWKYGDMSDDEILLMKEKNKQIAEVTGTAVSDIWAGSYHLINRDKSSIYDTTQDVPEYKPRGYLHRTLYCIDPKCDHENKDAPNYCNYKKVEHELV